MRAVLCIGLALLAVVVVARPAHHHGNVFEMDHSTGSGYTFEMYLSHFNKKYERHAHEFHRKVFAENFEKIKAHNSDKTKTWKKAVNRFTDMTTAQRSAFLGTAVQSPSHLLGMARTQVELPHTDMSALPASVDWRTVTPSVITPVKDQLSCGSCWAHGATEQVETYTAMATGTLLKLSRQELVDCAPNPDDCGGTGGCGGSTAELGFQYVSQAGGMATEAAYPYKGVNQPCNAKNVKNSATVGGWNVLPANNYTAVMQAVATIGPLAINVDASNWFDYSSGVYTGCTFDNIDIDHVVQLVGYGHDTPSGLDYWIVRNSWNTGYGEAGYIRVERHSAGTNEFCGPDTKPSDGTGCNGGPAEVEVCGSCGLWYDTSYPTGAALVQ